MSDKVDDNELEKQRKINILNNQKSNYSAVKSLIEPITTDLDNVKIKFKDTEILSGLDEFNEIISNIDIIKTSVSGINNIIDTAISNIETDVNIIKNQ